MEREHVDDMLVLENWVTRYLIANIKREQQKISKQKPLYFLWEGGVVFHACSIPS